MSNPEIKWIPTFKELPPPKGDYLIVVNLDGKPFVTHALYKPFDETLFPDGKWCWRNHKIIGETPWTNDLGEGLYMEHEITHWAYYPSEGLYMEHEITHWAYYPSIKGGDIA